MANYLVVFGSKKVAFEELDMALNFAKKVNGSVKKWHCWKNCDGGFWKDLK